jgi:hypothetical protein
MDLRYRDVERALVDTFGVPEGGLGALRARIRHLRNVGVPELQKVGSGTQLTYTRKQAFELLLAIELELSGISPRLVPAISRFGADKFFETPTDEKVFLLVTRSLDFTGASPPKARRSPTSRQPGRSKVQQILVHTIAKRELPAPSLPVGVAIFPAVGGMTGIASVFVGNENLLNQIRNNPARHLLVVNLSACNAGLPAHWK